MTSYTTISSLSRRSALRLVTLSAGGALLAACGVAPVAPPTAAPTPAAAKPPAPTAVATAAPTTAPAAAPTATVAAVPASAPAPQVKTGGTLRFAATADIPNLDGHQRSATLTDTVWTAYDRLTQYDANGKVQPMLAESWDVTPDYKQVKFNLRKGVQFHTGRELTSDDVKWNILRVRDPKVGSGSYVTWSNWFTSIETPDKNTIVLTTDASRPSMFDFFEWLNILDPGHHAGAGRADEIDRHRSVRVQRMEAGRVADVRQEPQLLGVRQAVHRRLCRARSSRRSRRWSSSRRAPSTW